MYINYYNIIEEHSFVTKQDLLVSVTHLLVSMRVQLWNISLLVRTMFSARQRYTCTLCLH